ncbi:hypothetical protein TrVE_jg856 [Triparma verrucosa]|uniref:Uncharacterized protein n=1 Tax=Triparma verrucosa TaxID=1606542 RepID=A0A9W7CEQ7_9STRA|nr:hypothetical protein TrVE_jg856 [Triparma verrucosa]
MSSSPSLWNNNSDYSHDLGRTLSSEIGVLWNHYFQVLFGPYSYITWVISNQVRRKTIDLHFEPQRHYHTLVHIYELLDVLRLTKTEIGPTNPNAAATAKQNAELFFAAVFHDCVYDPKLTGGKNETLSNDHFAAFADLVGSNSVVPPSASSSVATVKEIILCTIKHTTESSNPTVKRFLNADINVLSKPLPCYESYAHMIRLEYIHVSRPDYLKGRVAVLESFLSRAELFFKIEGEDVSAKEKQARDNIKWEISLLKTKQVIPGEGKKIEKSVERAESERKLKILAILTICVGISYILARRRRN